MKQNYPNSYNMWLRNYPRMLRVTFGPSVSLLEGPWVNGQQLILTATMLSKKQEERANKIYLRAIYTDTGEEHPFAIKMIMDGWGTFIYDDNVDNYWLVTEKMFRINSAYNGKTFSFHRMADIYTQVSKSIEIPYLTVPSKAPVVIEPPTPPEEEENPSPSPGDGTTLLPPTEINHNIFARYLLQNYASKAIPPFTFYSNGTISVTKQVGDTLSIEAFINLYEAGCTYRSAQSYYGDYWVNIFEIYGIMYVVFLRNTGPDIVFDGSPQYSVEYVFRWTSIKLNNVERINNIINIRREDR